MANLQLYRCHVSINCIGANALQARDQLREQHTAHAPLVCVVCGPKNVGKSSFARHLVNDLLQSEGTDAVAFLEADCGQPAVGPPACVSLSRLTEPQLLLATMCTAAPDHCAFVGDTSAEGHPALYLAAIAKLAAIHRARWRTGTLFLYSLSMNAPATPASAAYLCRVLKRAFAAQAVRPSLWSSIRQAG